MESVDCCNCGPGKKEMLFTYRKFGIVQCANCNLVFTDPRLDSRERDAVYSCKDYFGNKIDTGQPTSSGFDYIGMLRRGNLEEPKRRFEIVRRLHSDSGFVLDIGAGIGLNLLPALEAGWPCDGVEPSSYAVNVASSIGLQLQLGIFDERFVDNTLKSKKIYDVVTLYHVLEHLENPRQTLNLCYQLLRKGGLLVIEVPDFGSRYAQILKDEWPELKPWEHIHHFTEPVLRRMVENSGFQPLRSYHHGGIGAFLAARTSSPPMVNAARRMLFDMRRLVYTSKQMKTLLRFFYWEIMRNHNIVTLVCRK